MAKKTSRMPHMATALYANPHLKHVLILLKSFIQGIVKSLDKNEWISEDNFEVTGCPGSSNDTPAKARLNAVKQVHAHSYFFNVYLL